MQTPLTLIRSVDGVFDRRIYLSCLYSDHSLQSALARQHSSTVTCRTNSDLPAVSQRLCEKVERQLVLRNRLLLLAGCKNAGGVWGGGFENSGGVCESTGGLSAENIWENGGL